MSKDIMSISDFKNLKPKKKNKYNAVNTTIDGYKFDSQAEAIRYGHLKLLKLSGDIVDFKMQVPYKLEVNGKHICKYIADFVVYNNDGSIDVEDVKSVITQNLPVFKLKEKMMDAILGIKIKIVK